MKYVKGIKYCGHCINSYGFDPDEPEIGPAEAELMAKGTYENYDGRKVPYRANLCMDHFWHGTVNADTYPEYTAFRPIAEKGWKLALELAEEDLKKYDLAPDTWMQGHIKRIDFIKRMIANASNVAPDRETNQEFEAKNYIKFNHCGI
tara:strand:- start:647 stop:1090 length:444 start_codon:yes stop_codon:yes gene_type:complete